MKTVNWTAIGVVVSLIIGSVNFAFGCYQYYQTQIERDLLSAPRMAVDYVAPIVFRSRDSYEAHWEEKLQIVVFVASIHEFSVKVRSISFDLSNEGRSHIDTNYAEKTRVTTKGVFERHGVSSGTMDLPIVVEAEFWLKPASTVYETLIQLGTLTLEITLVDIRTNQTISRIHQTTVAWSKGTR